MNKIFNQKSHNRQSVSKPVVRAIFENPMNQERWVCENVNDVKIIDGVEFLQVHRHDNQRVVLMRKDALRKVKK